MKVLVVGSGGREHALAWKIGQSPLVDRVFVAPGNAGTAVDAENVDIGVGDFEALIQFAKQNEIGLTVVGPEAPLCDGLVDAFQAESLKAFGPSKAAAQMEGSKVFCKRLMHGAGVPSAEFSVFSDPSDGMRYVNERFPDMEDNAVPLVVKADGLAAGKGAIVCQTRDEVMDAIDRIARSKEFGAAGNQFVIEELLPGEEISVLAITDGRTILTLPPAQDHKRALDGDLGPNTGGMGAYCPTPQVDHHLIARVEENILVPTVHAMKRGRTPFSGILYAGLMVNEQGIPKVLEYNVRFGDPECQPLLMRLKTDLVEIMLATIDRRLEEVESLEWDERPAVCVVMASEGYPGSYEKGLPISGLDKAAKIEDVKVFHAGTKLDGESVVTTGGRVLGVTAIGSSVADAKRLAYTAVKEIRFPGGWCRKDISDKAITAGMKS